MRTEKLSVVVPCFNEEGNIVPLVARTREALNAAGIEFEIILVDDGSSDETWSLLDAESLSDREHVHALRNRKNLGLFASWQVGVAHSSGDLVCLMDADLQSPPETLPLMWRRFHETQCHILQGTRSSIEWDRGARFMSSRGLNVLLNATFGDRATDNKSGFVIAPREIMKDILDFKRSYQFPQTFIRVSAQSKGYRVEEMETLFQPRRAGTSFLSSKPALQTYARVLGDFPKALREFGRGPRHPMEAIQDRRQPVEPRTQPYTGPRKLLLDSYFATMPLHAWLIRPSTKGIYETLTQTQWLDRQDIRELQNWRLRRMLWHAYVHVPYYHRLFVDHGLHPSNFHGIEDLALLPMLAKQDVSSNLYFDLFSDEHDKKSMHKIATSGSTGQPFVTYADRQQLEIRFASTLRSLEWTGWRVGDKQVRLWHQRLGMSRSQATRERLDALMLRRTFIPAFEMTEEGLQQLATKLGKVNPVLIDGYAESLNFLASYLEQGGKGEFAPKAVMSSAQMLTEGTRNQIERGLGCRVYDKYGAREFSGIAYQCGHGLDHHVLDESYVVEILKEGRPARPGETGEVVITDLNNYSVPLIRYRIGDLAIAADNSIPCQCGRGLSRIGEIQGRSQALVHCANGRWIPGTSFAHFFKEYDYMVQFFQVVQTERGSFLLNIVKGLQWSEALWQDLMANLREYVGSTDVVVNYVDSIPLLATGKRTPVISSVRVDFQSLTG